MNHFEADFMVSLRVVDSKVLRLPIHFEFYFWWKSKMANVMLETLDGFSVVRVLMYQHWKSSFLRLIIILNWVMGCGMGPLFVLVSPCFRENVVVTCKIGSFLYNLDNLLQENVFVFFFGNSKWRSFEKRTIFDLLFTFFSTCTYMYFAYPIDLFFFFFFFFALTILKKKYEFFRYGFSLVWVMVLILICAILEQSINNKIVSKI